MGISYIHADIIFNYTKAHLVVYCTVTATACALCASKHAMTSMLTHMMLAVFLRFLQMTTDSRTTMIVRTTTTVPPTAAPIMVA